MKKKEDGFDIIFEKMEEIQQKDGYIEIINIETVQEVDEDIQVLKEYIQDMEEMKYRTFSGT